MNTINAVTTLILFILHSFCVADELFRFDFSEGLGRQDVPVKTYDSINEYSCTLFEAAELSTDAFVTFPSSLHFTTFSSSVTCAAKPEYTIGYQDFTLELFLKITSVVNDVDLVAPRILLKQELISQMPRVVSRNYGIFARPGRVGGELSPANLQFSTLRTGDGFAPFGNYDLFDNQWHHIAIVFHQNTTAIQFYIDFQLDVLRFANTGMVPGDNVNNGDLTAGGSFTGFLDSVVLHNVAMDIETLRATALARIDGNVEICDGIDNSNSGTSDTPQLECALRLDQNDAPIVETLPCKCGAGNETRFCRPIACKWSILEACETTCNPTPSPTFAQTAAPTTSPPTLAPTLAGASTLLSSSTAAAVSTLALTSMGDSTADATTTSTESVANGTTAFALVLTTEIIMGIGGGLLLLVVACVCVAILCVCGRRRRSSRGRIRHDSRSVRLRTVNSRMKMPPLRPSLASRRSHSSAGNSRTSRSSRRGLSTDQMLNQTYALVPHERASSSATAVTYQPAPSRVTRHAGAAGVSQYAPVGDADSRASDYVNRPLTGVYMNSTMQPRLMARGVDDRTYGSLALRDA